MGKLCHRAGFNATSLDQGKPKNRCEQHQEPDPVQRRGIPELDNRRKFCFVFRKCKRTRKKRDQSHDLLRVC